MNLGQEITLQSKISISIGLSKGIHSLKRGPYGNPLTTSSALKGAIEALLTRV